MNSSTKPCRVVHFSSVHRWHDVRVFRRTCRSLASAGFDVHLIAICDEGDQPSVQEIDGVMVHSLRPATSRFQRMFGKTRAVVDMALELDARLYHFHDPELIPFVGRLVRTGRPVIYDAHEDLPKTLLGKDWLPKFVGRLLVRPVEWIERKGSSRFAAVVAAEEEIEIEFQNSAPRTLTIQNYPSLSEFPEPSFRPTHPPTIVHFGGLRQLRAIEPLIDAMGLLPDDLDCRLLTAGRCDSDVLLRRLQEKKGFKRVEHLGWLSFGAMREYLEQCTIAMNLFSRAPNNQRVRSNRFFESLATGVPVITSDFPDWKRIVGDIDCGICVDPRDPSAIAQAIMQLLTQPEEALAMAHRGRAAVVEKYNWESEFEKLERLYKEIM